MLYDVNKNMGEQIIEVSSKSFIKLWDEMFLDLINSAISLSGNVITREKKNISREGCVYLFNILDTSDLEPKLMLLHKDVFELMKAWLPTNNYKDDLATDVLLDRELVVSCKEKIQDDVYIFADSKFLGSSFMSKPELKLIISGKSISWEVRIMTARNIGNCYAVGRSQVELERDGSRV